MPNTYSGDLVYFDELALGISSGADFDDVFYFDGTPDSITSLTFDITITENQYIANEVIDLEIAFLIEAI